MKGQHVSGQGDPSTGLDGSGETSLAARPARGSIVRQRTQNMNIVKIRSIGLNVIAGFVLGRPGHEGLIPSGWVHAAVGNNTLLSTLLASLLGALMYFSTLTEVPIVQGLMGAGMGKGPALALLLASPAL